MGYCKKGETGMSALTIHEFLDFGYGLDGDRELVLRLENGAIIDECYQGETPLHVAARRRRETAVAILIAHGASLDLENAHGKTAYAHAIRRGFDEVAELLAKSGADTTLSVADRFAVAVVRGRMDEALRILNEYPEAIRTGNPEEDRLLADMAGRDDCGIVRFLVDSGADLTSRGLDSGTPLHQAAWFGQPRNARLLLDAGAPVNDFESTHNSSPLGWAVHGARYSGGAEERQEVYAELVGLLLEAGSSLEYPGDPGGRSYYERLMEDATDTIRPLLVERNARG